MSTGKSYAKMETSDAERLSEIERKFESIRGRISAYDQVLDEFKKIKEQIAKFPSLIEENKSEIISTQQVTHGQLLAHKMLINNVEAAIEKLPQKFAANEEAFWTNSKHTEEVARDLAHLSKDITQKIESTTLDKLPKSTFADFQNLHSEQLFDMKNFQKATESRFMGELENIAGLIGDHHDKLEEVDKLKAQNAQLSVWMASFEEKVSKKIQEAVSASSKSQKDHLELTQDALYKMKQDLVGTPTSNAAVEARIMNRLEMATLDGSNAVLKANNMADKVKLLEKKVEALTTQLGQYALPR